MGDDAAVAEPEPRTRWRRCARRALPVVAVVVLVLAAGLTVVGAVARRDASELRTRQAGLERRLARTTNHQRDVAAELRRSVDRADAASRALAALAAGVDDQAASSNRAAGVLNRAAGQFNAGRRSDAIALLGSEGTDALAGLQTTTDEVVAALAAAERDVADLLATERG